MAKKGRNRFEYTKNRKRAWKNSKKLPAITCPQIKENWDKKKSVRNNLHAMGLAIDPNDAVPVPKVKKLMGDLEVEPRPKPQLQKEAPTKLHVIDDLQAEANLPTEKRMRLSEPEVQLCIYMMEKHGEDYKAMSMDRRNYYQETPKAMRAKIRTFMSIPSQYQAYLDSKKQSTKTEKSSPQKMETST